MGGGISHHDEFPTVDEDLSPSLENMVVLNWLILIHQELPRLVKQRYGTELRSRTLASLKPEISQALGSLLDEIHSMSETKILRQSTYYQPRTRFGPARPQSYQRTQRAKQCPLCKQAGRPVVDHYLSACKYLPEQDRLFMTKASNVTGLNCEDSGDDESPVNGDYVDDSQNVSTTCRVNTKQSPFFKAFYRHHPICLTLDTGAETNMIRESVARSIGAKITKSSQLARQLADGVTPLNVVGETQLMLSRDNLDLHLDALVVKDLDVDVLAGTPFMTTNDIAVRPAKNQIRIDEIVIHYGAENVNRPQYHKIRRAQTYVLRAPPVSTTVWPGEYIQLSIPSALNDLVVEVEPRYDQKSTEHYREWPQPAIIEAVGDKIRLLNTCTHPLQIGRNEHLCQVRGTTAYDTNYREDIVVKNTSTHTAVVQCSDAIELDNGKLLSDDVRYQFRNLHEQYDTVFSSKIVGYNGHAGPFTATVNMGPVQPPQRKGRCPQYARDKLVELQDKFNELKAAGVFRRPEDIGVVVEYLNPSFLVRKANGGSRLVTAFTEEGRYSKPKPSLMPDVDSILRSIACWKYIVVSDLTNAFYQIPLSNDSQILRSGDTISRCTRLHTVCHGHARLGDGFGKADVPSLGRPVARGRCRQVSR